METRKITIWEAGEYTYPFAFGFTPNLRTYLHTEDEKLRPAMIVVPGGGYSVCAPAEGEPVAKKFCEMGCNSFVLTYTTNLLAQVPLKDQPMKDLARAIRYVRLHAEELHIRKDAVMICGFSAGGHLCGSVCVHWEEIRDENPAYEGISDRPDAAVLGYPVITAGKYCHEGSFRTLCGADADEEIRNYYSLEKQVTKQTPPCFVWQTVTDEEVPSENSALFAQALKAAGVPFAYHLFSEGPHAMSLADEDWAQDRFGEPYVLEQTFGLIQAIQEGKLGDAPELGQVAEYFLNPQPAGSSGKKADPEVAVWPQLAWAWLQKNI